MTGEQIEKLAFYGEISLLRDALFLAYSKELSSADLTRLSGSSVVALLNAHNEASEMAARVQKVVFEMFKDMSADSWLQILNHSQVAQPRPGNAPLDPNEPIVTVDDRAVVADRIALAVKAEAAR